MSFWSVFYTKQTFNIHPLIWFVHSTHFCQMLFIICYIWMDSRKHTKPVKSHKCILIKKMNSIFYFNSISITKKKKNQKYQKRMIYSWANYFSIMTLFNLFWFKCKKYCITNIYCFSLTGIFNENNNLWTIVMRSCFC